VRPGDGAEFSNVHIMIQRRALAAGIATKIRCHSFRATGITTCLQNGGKLEVAQQIPALWHGQKDRRSES
jgi:site-specific recombinase XerD